MRDHTRRRFAITVGSLAFAGCSDETDDESGPQEASNGTDATYTVRVSRLSEERFHDQAGIAAINVVSSDVRTAFRAAIDGGYETESVPSSLAAALDRYDFVVDDHYYELQATIPEWTLRLEPSDDVDEAAAIGQDEWEGIDGWVLLLTAMEDEAVTRYDLPEDVRELADSYDYVADRPLADDPEKYYRIEIDRDDPDPPYELTASAVDAETVFESVGLRDFESLPEEVRTEFETALDRGDTEYDDRPATADYFSGDGLVRRGDSYYAVVVIVTSPSDR